MKFKLTEVQAEFMEKMNDVLNDWEDMSYKPNAVKQVEDTIKRFYDNNNIEVRDDGRFDTNIELESESQLEEMTNIAQMSYNQDIWLDDLESKFEKAQGKHGLQTMEDYTRFIDAKTKFENSVLSSSKMSYYEYEALQKKASKDKRRNPKSTDRMIEDVFLKKGLTGNDLYDYVYKRLSKKKR